MNTGRFGPNRKGKSHAVESVLVMLLYSMCYLITFNVEKSALTFENFPNLLFGLVLPWVIPSPLPLFMWMFYFVTCVVMSYFERSVFLYFLIGATIAAAVSAAVKTIEHFSGGPFSPPMLMGDGITGTTWWLLTTMVGASILVRALRLRFINRRENRMGTNEKA